jgi:hypothetical protein
MGFGYTTIHGGFDFSCKVMADANQGLGGLQRRFSFYTINRFYIRFRSTRVPEDMKRRFKIIIFLGQLLNNRILKVLSDKADR